MGDMADYALDQVMDSEDDCFLYRAGEMSDTTAYDLGIIDEMGYCNHPPMFHSKSRTVTKTCKHCGKTGLHWKDTGSGWRLVSVHGELHMCEQHRF